MFLKKFPDNALIQKIKINGRFISIYVPKERLETYQNKINNQSKKYPTLWIGEGVMHDYAHNSQNTHMKSLYSNKIHQKEHFHHILPSLANPTNLESFLDIIEDLTDTQKQEIIKDFQQYHSTISLEKTIESLKTYYYLIGALQYQDGYFTRAMPLFNAFMTKVSDYVEDNAVDTPTSDADQTNSENKPDAKLPPALPATIKINNYQLKGTVAKEICVALLNHFKIIAEIHRLMNKWQTKSISKEELIAALNKTLQIASSHPNTNIRSLMPDLYHELIINIPLIDENFSTVYSDLKQQLETILETNELVFNQVTPGSNNHENVTYTDALFKLTQLGGTLGEKIQNAMKRLKEHEKDNWNPYWINSNEKLQQIITAVNKLTLDTKLEEIIQDPNSELYSAVNMTRLLPITFLGSLSFKAKSLLMIEEQTPQNTLSK